MKIFRRFRASLLRHDRQESAIRFNRIRRYMLYAMGEIILVVLGILIALWVNNWNQKRIYKNQLDASLGVIQNDLVADSTLSSQIMEWIQGQDSLAQRFLVEDLSMELYRENPSAFGLSLNYQPMRFSKEGYNRLKSLTQSQSMSGDKLVADILALYESAYTMNDTRRKLIEESIMYHSRQMDEAGILYDLMVEKQSPAFKSYFTSKPYQGRLAFFREVALRGYTNYLQEFNARARELLKDLDKRGI